MLLVIGEGLASYFLLVFDLTVTSGPPYRRHIKYDPELGWVNMPNVHIPDQYGRGIYLTTNSAGFRNNREFAARVPDGKYRILCTGDSFTLGVGVDNDHTWCHLLTVLDPRIEAVNMGQPAYGVDQAYLLYKREGSKLDHQAHLFGLITWDIERMQSAQFQGYDKPVIDLKNGTLVIRNVPVPKRSYVLSWFTDRLAIFENLRTVDFARRVRRWIRRPAYASSEVVKKDDKASKTRDVLRSLFVELKRLNEDRGSELFLLYLPTLSDFQPDGSGGWREVIEEESRALGVPLINVFRRCQSLAYEDILSMFILPGQGTYPGVNHLSERGNAFVAKVIHEELKSRVAVSGAQVRSQR
ncbi:MAG: hypothetical protein ACHQPI_06580 [Thermoanaerobaculia bacterium]